MLEIKKTAVALDENDLLELERIIVDSDEKEALRFLKRAIYERAVHSQREQLKSHLDGGGDPVKKFIIQTK